jgi:REP element-mobilizing transposase RayT
MDQAPYCLDRSRREAVLASLLERCVQRDWSLLAAHVRTNHVHAVVEAEARPERVMNDLKSYASRYLNQTGLETPARKRWARHGSTRWLWKPESVLAAIRYVVDEQGDSMAVFEKIEL